MRYSIIIISNSIVLLIFVSQIGFVAAQQPLSCTYCNGTNGNYTSNSQYNANLRTLLNTISFNNTIDNGFYKLSIGQAPDEVYAIAICRVDKSIADCRSCLNDLSKRLPEECPIQKEATGFYITRCMLTYSNRPIGENNGPTCSWFNSIVIPEPDVPKFNRTLEDLFQALKRNASSGDSRFKFSAGSLDVTPSIKIYGLAQCNPDLTSSQCSNCLEAYINLFQFNATSGNSAQYYGTVCSVEYSNFALVSTVDGIISSPTAPNSSHGAAKSVTSSGNNTTRRANKTKIIIVVVVVVLLFIIASTTLTLISLSKRKMRKKQRQEKGYETYDQIECVNSMKFDFGTIQFATDNFSDVKRLGNRGDTAMYKGVLPDGQEIAVKRINTVGRDSELEFDNEVLLLANLQHKNLVKLLGFCVEKDNVRILVYEFLPNKSLQGFLHDSFKRASLDWQTRCEIIQGLARGLCYLHEDSQLRVIHRDLKPDNVLLGVQMDPKISNFRKASLIHSDQTRGDTEIVGTYGYMPPEYVQHGHASVKSDIFSYGVILLEIITGRIIISGFSDGENEECLITYAWRKWCEGTPLDMVDEALPNAQRYGHEIKRCIKIALLCVEEDPTHRPSMSNVVLMLNSNTVHTAEPIRPAALILSSMDLRETSLYRASVSELDPR